MKIHFIGIGGIGVSALAQYYLEKGYQISGSDLASSEITQALKKKGAQISIGPHSPQNLTPEVKQVIYSPAIRPDNPELEEARKGKIKIQSYPEALGELTKKYWTIAVSGTHGKSTTTAMIGLLLEKAGFDPTVIVGTKLKEWGDSNCRVGKSKYLVIEADEWQASFLNYWPKIIVLTSIEREHLDYFQSLNHILNIYREYTSHIPEDGVLVANKADNNIQKLIKSSPKIKNLKYYFFGQKETSEIKKILKIPGEHNVSNALAALSVAQALEIPDRVSFQALSKYRGSWRRFEIIKIHHPKQFTLINDYAHHPTKVRVTLKAAREKFPKEKIWCIFQPHQYQRTYYLFNDFVKVFQGAPIDRLIITDIYDVAGREKKDIKAKISSEKIIEAIDKPWAIYLPKEKIVSYLKKNLRGKEIVILMGAGDIYKLAQDLKKTIN